MKLADQSAEPSLIGQEHVQVPVWLDWKHLRYRLCLHVCRQKNKRYAVYNKLIELGFDTFNEDMDIIRMIRRQRLYCSGLHYLLDKH